MRLTMNPSISFSTTIGVLPMRRDQATARERGFVGRLRTAHDLAEVHHQHRVKEVHVAAKLRTCRRIGEARHHDVARVGRDARRRAGGARRAPRRSRASPTESRRPLRSPTQHPRQLMRGRSSRVDPARRLRLRPSRSSLPFSTRRSSHCRFDAIARCSTSALTSTSETSMPLSAACCAICAPMVPAPTTSRRPSAPSVRWHLCHASSGQRTGTRVVHSVSSCDALV